MTRILVTGANGQLGKSIQKIASDYPKLAFLFKNSKELDITDTLKLEKVFEQVKYDYCINCAAYTNVEKAESEEKKAFSINAEGVRNIAESCLKNDVALIHISTDYVFDGEKKEPYTINDEPNPINVYGASKVKGENYIQEILDSYFIIRTSWLYSEFGKNFYQTILRKAQAGELLQITDEQIGCPTHARNLSQFILNLIDSGNANYGVHHFTDGKAMTWYCFAEKILIDNKLGDTVNLKKAKNYRTFARRPKNSVLKTD
jgi:dTDP-4-dehydrorhamnose reductase